VGSSRAEGGAVLRQHTWGPNILGTLAGGGLAEKFGIAVVIAGSAL
jgi:hypothetical protein